MTELYSQMTEKPDQDLVRECLDGDNNAFAVLVRKYERPLFNLALRMVRDREDAMDVTQTVFTKAYEHLDTYNPRHQFFSWAYRIAVNESINFCKKRKIHTEYESGMIAIKGASPEERVHDDALTEELHEAISALKTDYRMVIVLKHYHDFSYQEMGDILQIPEKTVKSRLFSARQRLREIMSRGEQR